MTGEADSGPDEAGCTNESRITTGANDVASSAVKAAARSRAFLRHVKIWLAENPMPPGYLCDDCPVPKRFGHDGCLDIIRPLTATASPRDHFDPLKAVGGFGKRLAHRRTTRSMTRRISKEPSLSPLRQQNGR